MIACVPEPFAFVAEDADICGVGEAGREALAELIAGVARGRVRDGGGGRTA